MEFDLIISNPPYGKSGIGADITNTIKDTIEYKEFINLMPATDYYRANDYNLWQYTEDMESVIKGFEGDANITPRLCRITKTNNGKSLEEFELEQYIDPSLDKFLRQNTVRKFMPIENMISNLNYNKQKYLDVNTTVIFGWRDPAAKHMPYKKSCNTYKWNVEKSIDSAYLYEHQGKNSSGVLSLNVLTFETANEKDNFTKFFYSIDGFRFMSKVFTAINIDMVLNSAIKRALPKVDWTRSWTVEEILSDYGYTEAEIKEVMEDLKNFRGMND